MGEFDHLRDWDPYAATPVEDRVRDTLRDLAVNLLRVIRGAGASYDLIRQVRACDEAFRRHVGEKQQGVSAQDLDAMMLWRPEADTRGDTEARRSETDIVRASLRIVAAELDGNRIQQAAGERDLREAIRRFNEARS